jgi:hypothetical protein
MTWLRLEQPDIIPPRQKTGSRIQLERAVLAVAFLVNLSFPSGAVACSCVWGGPFSKVALHKAVIILGEVLSYHKNSMDVQIIEVIRGTEDRKTIRIWGDNGALCRPYVTHFPIGTTWLLAISALPTKTVSEQLKSGSEEGFISSPANKEYAISVCGELWLKVSHEEAVGRITVDHHSKLMERVPLKEIIAWHRSNGTAFNLSATPVPVSEQ